MDNKQENKSNETQEDLQTKKQFWKGWAEQAQKESPSRKKFMEDSMAAFLKLYPEETPDK